MSKEGPDKRLEWVQPQQARSRRRLEQLLDAGEALMAEKGLDRVTVAEIAERAGASVGAFYTRFPDKDALFYSVLQRFYEQLAATAEQATDPERWRGVPLPQIAEQMLLFAGQVILERRQVIASMLSRAAHDPRVRAYLLAARDLVQARILALLTTRDDVAQGADMEARVRTLLWLLLSGMSITSLLGPDAFDEQEASETLHQTKRLILRQLGATQADAAQDPKTLN